MVSDLPRPVAPTDESESESGLCWRLPTPRELVAIVTVVLVVGNALAEHGFIASGTLTARPDIIQLQTVEPQAKAAATRLWELASSRAVESRGIVLPLFDDIAVLGLSLIMELRALQVEVPIEVPHCGDLNESLLLQLAQRNDTTINLHVYDVCEAAAAATETATESERETMQPLFCDDLDACHQRFRSFDIKILAVLFSRFRELLLVDADVLFFQTPATLWDLDKYVSTGTFFFPDRISSSRKYLSRRVIRDSPHRSRLHEFVETFDRTPYRHLGNVPLASTTAPGEPSEYLRATHAWNLRAGHHADSSVMLWNKFKQPRATAILGSFVTLHHAHRPPSYGDKELYFLACEVADSHYAFSNFGVGSVGWDADHERGVLCGDALHFHPTSNATSNEPNALYINSDHITSWDTEQTTLYRSNARPASHYPGSFEARNLTQECPFDIEPIELTVHERNSFRRRQELYESLNAEWSIGSKEDDESEEASNDKTDSRGVVRPPSM